MLISVGHFTVNNVTFNSSANGGTLWHPVRKTSTDFRINKEEV